MIDYFGVDIMEYAGFLLLGAAVAGIAFRCYFSMKKGDALLSAETSDTPHTKAQEEVLAQRLLNYHLSLPRA
jgi:hypothetical protein